ncbi:MAG: lipase family protein [Pseudomonadota bacterium]
MQFDQAWFSQPGFSWHKAYGLALACELAYEPTETVKETLHRDWRMSGVVFDIGDMEGFVAVGTQAIIVSIRGTQGVRDWINVNLRVPETEFAPIGGAAHRGFVAGWTAISDVVGDAMAEHPTKTVWFTGHSLGAAVAILGAAAAAPIAPDIITFGQPRIFNAAAANHLNATFGARYHRVVHGEDVVARIPRFYHHAGRLFHFPRMQSALAATASATATAGPVEVTASLDGPTPLSQEEEKALEEDMATVPTTGMAATAGLGNKPGIEDHRIGAYVQLMARQIATS